MVVSGAWMLSCAARPVPPPVDCKGNGDCVTPRTQCSNGICAAISAAECMEAADCIRGFSCKDGTCQVNTTCQADVDCPAGRVCTANQCATSCSLDRECALGSWCHNAICRESKAILCADNEDCPVDADCDTDAKTCSKVRANNKPEPCADERSCRSSEFCHTVKKVCVAESIPTCHLDSECPTGYVCLTSTMRCEPKPATACTKNEDCNTSANQTCDTTAKLCVQSCAKNEDCSVVGQVCQTDSKMCVASCRSHIDCPGTWVCDFTTHRCRART